MNDLDRMQELLIRIHCLATEVSDERISRHLREIADLLSDKIKALKE